MINILLVLNIIVVILLIAIILLQKSEGGVLGMGGGGSKNGVLTTRSAGNLITKITYILAAMFFVICIFLATLVSRRQHSQSFVEGMHKKAQGIVETEIKLPSVNEIPELEIKQELLNESIKKEDVKPLVPTS